MGGVGSGRRRDSLARTPDNRRARQTTDQHVTLDVLRLKREGLIAPGQERVALQVSFRKRRGSTAPGPKWVDMEVRLRLAWTPCNYGGSRPWFVCPGEGCGRRAVILYGPSSPFLCRQCRGLCYASQLAGAARRRSQA